MIGQEQDKLHQQLANLKAQNNELQQKNQRLELLNQDAHEKVASIKKQNHDLQEKNQLAAERTQVVLKRLTRIDQIEG